MKTKMPPQQKPQPLGRYDVVRLFKEAGYEIVSHLKQEIIGVRGTTVIQVYPHINEVATTVDHPLWGRNTLRRHSVGYYRLKAIIANPRLHTKQGYRNSPLQCKKCGSKRCYCPCGEPHFKCDHDVWQHKPPPNTPKPSKKKKSRLITKFY